MQEKQPRLKLPSAWKPDQWICHHQGDRHSMISDDHDHRQSKEKPLPISHNSEITSLHQGTKGQIENSSLTSHSSRKSRVKRLITDGISQKSHHSLTPVLHIPQMSQNALKRWCETRDAYLGDRYPYKQVHRRKPKSIKQKDKIRKNEEIASIFTLESDQFSAPTVISTEKQHRLSRKNTPILQLSPSETELEHTKRLSGGQTQIICDHFDDKCVGTEVYEPALFKIPIEQMDQAVQADLPPPQFELYHEYDASMVDGEKKEEIQVDRPNVEYDDKATETDFIVNIEKENQTDDDKKSIQQEDVIVDNHKTRKNVSVRPSTISNRIVPLTDPTIDQNDDDDITIISSTESNISAHKQLLKLQIRFARLSKERRLLSCLLVLYVIIMSALLVVIFILLWSFQGRSSTIYREITVTSIGITNGVARYDESCDNDNDCKRPLICHKKRSSSPGMCRCPLKYDFIQDECIGDVNALCTKDSDCQRYMLCSGMEDGTRRCHCQTLFNYDIDRKQCRGGYHASCESNIDCQANFICNKTSISSLCSCKSHYQYYPLIHRCRGDPGAVCNQATDECTNNSECRDGACECTYQFVPDENKICVNPCPELSINPGRIRYPGNCRRFIDCQQRSKTECPEMTIFNLRTQLCDYPKNVLDCR